MEVKRPGHGSQSWLYHIVACRIREQTVGPVQVRCYTSGVPATIPKPSIRTLTLMKNTQAARVRFGVFELDLRSGELRQGDDRILLQEQPLQILRMLVEREGEVVPREEIKKSSSEGFVGDLRLSAGVD